MTPKTALLGLAEVLLLRMGHQELGLPILRNNLRSVLS